MSTDNRKVQLGIEVRDDTKAGLESVQRNVRDTARVAEQEGAKASKGLDGIGKSADGAAKRTEAATKSLIAQIQRVTAETQAGQRGTEEYFKALAQQRGLDQSLLDPYLKQLSAAKAAQDVAARSMDGLGMSAKQTTAALRQVPAQFTDIVVSLQSGQAPMTVLLQQGGQLKDVFGGVGAAARALGGYVASLITPLTAAGAAALAVAAGFLKGSQEAQRFTQTLVTSGNALGLTAQELQSMAASVDQASASITQSKAAEVLNQLAASGKVGADNFVRFAKAAAEFETAGGQAAEETIKVFAELGKAPLEASLKLGEATNYLTREIYDQIKALEAQGRTTDAARVAQEAYANAIETQTPKLVERLGWVESAWAGIKRVASEALDQILQVGRSNPLREIEQQLQFAYASGAGRAEIEGLEAKYQAVKKVVDAEKERARAAADVQARERASIALAEQAAQADGQLANQRKRVAEATELFRKATAGLSRDSAQYVQAEREYLKVVSEITKVEKERNASAGPAKRNRDLEREADLLATLSGVSTDYVRSLARIQAMRERGAISEARSIELLNELIAKQPMVRDLLKQQADAEKAKAQALEESYKAEARRIDALDRSAASVEAQLQRLLDEEQALAIAAEKHITLAQAIEEVEIARLREKQAALMREGDRDAEVLAIQKEIDARRELAKAIGRKEAREVAADAAKDAAREWQRAAEKIQDTLTDALMRGFESGKDFARNLRDTVINMFRTLVLRPVIQAVVAPVAGTVAGVLGLPTTANAGQLSNSMGLASGIKSVYDTVVGGFTALGDSVAFAAQDIGAWLVNNTSGVLNQAGSTLMQSSNALGTAASYVAAAAAGITVGSWISNGYSAIGKSGNTANIAGTAIGAFLGGPIGAVIGGALGGVFNRAFGRKAPVTTGSGITGTFSTDGADVQQYQEWFSKGGWFRSDKSGVNYSAVSTELDQFLDQSLRQITMATKMYAGVLGLNADAINGITQGVRISLMNMNAEQQQEAIMKALGGFGDRLAEQLLGEFVTTTVVNESRWGRLFGGAVAGALDKAFGSSSMTAVLARVFGSKITTVTTWVAGPFVRAGETAGEALARLANSLVTVNQVFDTLNQTLLHASLVGGDAASKLLDAFGGADAFTQSTSAYYQAFYSDAERVDTATRQLSFALESMGLVLPRTRAEFRALVEAQDLYSDSGRQTYAALLKLAPVFNEIQTAAESFANAFEAALRGVFDGLNESVRRTRQSVASAREDIAGRAIMDPDQIRNAIQAAMVTAPSTSGLTAADALVANRQGSVNTLTGLSDAANATAQQQLAALQAQQGGLAGAQQSLANLDASRQARRDEFNRIWLGRIGSYRWRLSLGDVYRQEEAQYQQQAEGLRAYIAALSGAVATQQSIYDTAAASAANYSAQLTAAQAALESSLAAQQTAREQYAASVREYIAAAGRSVETLSSLRQSVVDYYESQRALADAMVGSATRLRDAAALVRFGQLTPDQNAARLSNQFQLDYSMALATSGVTRAQYADRLTDTLPQLSEALRSTARTQQEWTLSTARLVAQSNTVAQLLEDSAPVDYEAESLALLDQIDAVLESIQAQTASAEQVISSAIYETGAKNLVGLRAIVAALRGEEVPRFAAGGLHNGGLRLVGERGPELEVTGAARYWSYEQTRQMMQGTRTDDSAAEIRALREDNRAQARAMVQLQQRFTRLLERWDAQGMPEVRVEA